jgi:hypothetical protein
MTDGKDSLAFSCDRVCFDGELGGLSRDEPPRKSRAIGACYMVSVVRMMG